MDTIKFFSTRDFFNYYLAGVIWLFDITVLLVSIGDPAKMTLQLDSAVAAIDKIPLLVLGILALILPYYIGFILNPLGGQVTRFLRWKFGDSVKWIFDYKDPRFKGKRLPGFVHKAILEKLKALLNFNKDETLIFFQVRAYVIEYGKGAAEFAERLRDLTNFCESLLVPFPLLFLILSGKGFISDLIPFGITMLVVGILMFWILSWRYLEYRYDWVKHTYRAFLTANTPDQIKQTNSLVEKDVFTV